MERFWHCLFVAFLIFAPLHYGPIIYHDATHPQLWVQWQHDPRIYGPPLAIIVVFMAGLFLWAWRKDRRERLHHGQSEVIPKEQPNDVS